MRVLALLFVLLVIALAVASLAGGMNDGGFWRSPPNVSPDGWTWTGGG